MSEQDASENKTGFSFDSLSNMHSEIQETSPEPNAEAIAAHEQASLAGEVTNDDAGKDTTHSGKTDSEGTVFNPNLHAVNAEGEPSLTPKGKFRKRRGTRSNSTVAKQSAAVQDAQQQQQRIANARASGRVAADMMISSSVMLLGPEWQPAKEGHLDERKNLQEAFENYFVAKDIADFPPGVALSIVCMSYALPRLTAGKETQTRLSKAKIWFTDRINNFKRKRKNAPQSDSRNDGKRQDDAGETTLRDESSTGARNPRS